MQVSQMWRLFSLADLRDLPGDPEVGSHYKRDRARWLHLNQTFRGNTEVDKPSVVPDTSIRENSERLDMLATPAECRNCIKKHPLNTPGPCRLPERCCSKDAALGKPSRALCCCSCSWLSSHEGIVLPRLSCLEDKGASLPDSFQVQFTVALQTLYQPWPVGSTRGLSQFALSVKPFS